MVKFAGVILGRLWDRVGLDARLRQDLPRTGLYPAVCFYRGGYSNNVFLGRYCVRFGGNS